MTFSRRSILGHAVALAPLLIATRVMSAPAAPVVQPIVGAALLDAWKRIFTRGNEAVFAWWFSGTLSAHVDSLREFPIAATNSVMICHAAAAAGGGVTVDWQTIGYFSDLAHGGPASSWDNVFTGKREAIPSRFAFGPGRYIAQTTGDDFILSLTETKTRVNRVILTGANSDGRIDLTQSEGKLQGFPHQDGVLPPLDAADVTELQTRLSFVSANAQSAAGHGFFSHVYDAIPAWLGFGDRLGSALSKGVMQKAAADEIVNPAVWAELKRRFPQNFQANRLKLS